MQDERSGSGLIYRRWLERQGVVIGRSLTSNSLMALLGLTVSGLGVSYLPVGVARPMLESGRLRTVPTRPALPPVPYVAMYRNDGLAPHDTFIVEEARRCCAFSVPI